MFVHFRITAYIIRGIHIQFITIIICLSYLMPVSELLVIDYYVFFFPLYLICTSIEDEHAGPGHPRRQHVADLLHDQPAVGGGVRGGARAVERDELQAAVGQPGDEGAVPPAASPARRRLHQGHALC